MGIIKQKDNKYGLEFLDPDKQGFYDLVLDELGPYLEGLNGDKGTSYGIKRLEEGKYLLSIL